MVSLLKEYFGYRSESKDASTAIMMAYKKIKEATFLMMAKRELIF